MKKTGRVYEPCLFEFATKYNVKINGCIEWLQNEKNCHF